MLANLVTTILLALGVATGNVSSNVYKSGNAFYDVEKQSKPIQKSEENTLSYSWPMTKVDEIDNLATGIPTAKYYIDNLNRPLQANATNGYFNIYNSTYVYSYKSGWSTTAKIVTLIKFTPYFNYNNERTRISSRINFAFLNTSNWYGIYTRDWVATEEILDYIDLTITSNTPNILEEYITNGTKTNLQTNTIDNTISHEYYNGNADNNYEILGLQAQQDYYVVLTTEINLIMSEGQQLEYATIRPDAALITGTAIIPDVNYEIIDLPNVMFTVLTMPFSFISTAFNLTIFPGTPYAINFGNLFLTILAIFILLWLLQKVFK